MNCIGPDTTADLFFQINWHSSDVHHTDAYAGHGVNLWRDMIPERLYQSLMGRQSGDLIHLNFSANELLGNNTQHHVRQIKRGQFSGGRIEEPGLEPRQGRFYPKGVLTDMAGVYKANREPFRCVDVHNGHLGVLMDHPLSGKEMELNVTLGSIHSKLTERGGSLQNWIENITHGVGMQARWEDRPTDFFSDMPYERDDETSDTEFYETPRMVRHVDETASDLLSQIYTRFITRETQILDLMSAWQSHLPDGLHTGKLTGLGLNETELKQNNKLDEYVVHDLNMQTHLPFDDQSFDLALCSLSVEYLIHPMPVFKEVARVIKPGGYFVVTFSNRWFADKVIRIWTDLHEYERMGMVLEFFKLTEIFDDLHTYSVRGLPRPAGDKYYGQLAFADPVYAVWGRRI